MGLMQLMPGTWRDVRRTLNLGADPFDPHDNIAAGAAYLRWLHERYGDAGFLAAYNAGPSRYDDHLATGRPLPAETISYVAQVRTLIGNPIVSSAEFTSKIVADWRAGSLFITAGKTVPQSIWPIRISMEKNAVQLHPFPADFFVARSAPEQDGDVRAEVVKP
ncbi:lytic transglycosylase domain-containing protein, partial [Gluconobacter thailandicus]|uniref:lytic transglycosylase domain-containing protein n=1 Tax=Gluconobacter thailandicus TaxID=257438 RepID=UPI0002EE1A61